MARHIVMNHHQVDISHMLFGIGTVLLCALSLFMCVSHSRRWRRWKSCYSHERDEPVIQLNQTEIVAYQFGDMDLSAHSGDGSLWKKNILMGGKCQLPEFSGVILYDSKGNVVAPAKNRSPLPMLPWK